MGDRFDREVVAIEAPILNEGLGQQVRLEP